MKQAFKRTAIAAVSLALLAFVSVFGASAYYSSERGQGCASCHEMKSYVLVAHDSPHRAMGCMECHDAGLRTKLRHTWVHITHKWPENIRLREVDVLATSANCQRCHQQEYATWHAGPHSATYTQIFTNRQQNSRQMLMDDCLRCHGMYFGGSIRDLVQPQNKTGPWHLVPARLADQPAMPCGACHWLHREGAPETKPAERISVAGEAIPVTLGFYDRREGLHFAADNLTIPQLYDGARALNVSQDPRQGICYQCHAPRTPDAGSVAAAQSWGLQAGSGDDRTPMGVHEGLSCFS
ncbi:MAG: multiheme c-type cytochrome, partial [Terracidiphilus sp.]